MKDHARMKEKVFALYDGQLPGEARLEAETHLKECAECRAVSERWSVASRVLFASPRPLDEEFFVGRVMGRIEALERPAVQPAPRWLPDFGWLVPAAGLAAALFILMQPAEPDLSFDALLAGETPGPNVAWVMSNRAATNDDVLEFALEGKR